ncbi:O-antigen ligase [Halococcus sp. IIIV-5B]|uniref:O-antigen ligase family protein n=1 Tax=Halococcus sp. IIIV-5B TaxID=2321230 RepID=UPI000E747BCB|nr:O-antigen ligase family protein [Halococcus sp. IIIV-5B]RJT02557.1 O-antigen ligase domain-containing protein [Halococcus sp. IIIV-5B]
MIELTRDRFDGVDNALSARPSASTPFVRTAALLTGLLAIGVPAVAAAFDLPTAAVVVGAGLCYLVAVVATGRAFEGFASAVVVLAVFDIGATLVTGPGIATLDLVAVDLVAIPLAVFLVADAVEDGASVGLNAGWLAAACLAGFVCWTVAAGAVANGGSETAGLMYGVEQLRYLVVFGVAALVARRTDVWCVVTPFVVAVAGNLVVSLAQVVNGGMLGFPFLGEPPDRYLGAFAFGPYEVATGFYAGGFVGHGRELTMLLLMVIPLAVAVAARRSWPALLAVGVGIVGAVLSIRVADTDAGWATLLLLGACFGLYLLGTLAVRTKRRYSTLAALPVVGALVVGLLALARVVQWIVTSADGGAQVFRTSSLDIRLEEYAAAIRLAGQYPWFGIGGGNFYIRSERYIGEADIGVHNTVLANLAATGYVGFGLYVLAVVAVLWVALRLAVANGGADRLLWAAVLAATCAFCAYSSWMSSYSWVVGNTGFWLLAGATVGATAGGYGTTKREISQPSGQLGS